MTKGIFSDLYGKAFMSFSNLASHSINYDGMELLILTHSKYA